MSDYRCTAGPDDVPFAEQHRCHSISYVRKGSFGCQTRGRHHELIAGAILVGHPGDEYTCTHEHHVCGDECLSFFLSPELVDTIGDRRDIWQSGSVPPLPDLMVWLLEQEPEGATDELLYWFSRLSRDGRFQRERLERRDYDTAQHSVSLCSFALLAAPSGKADKASEPHAN